jgi:dihydropteroate synthase
MNRTRTHWQCQDIAVNLGHKTLIMGILNTTPDSFSDGGQYNTIPTAIQRAKTLIQQGADIIDIGGESTRPGARPVSEQEEIQRTQPLIKALRQTHPNQLISIDTTKASVAEAALNAGANIINDISALRHDPAMAPLAAQSRAGIILMHMQGTPQTMQDNPTYTDVFTNVHHHLEQRMQAALQAGIKRNAIVIDPGIGFGKTLEHNLELLRNLHRFTPLAPVLVGLSRKRFIGTITQRENTADRLPGSLAAAAYALSKGIHILRVHDVIETCDLCRIFDRLLPDEPNSMDRTI